MRERKYHLLLLLLYALKQLSIRMMYTLLVLSLSIIVSKSLTVRRSLFRERQVKRDQTLKIPNEEKLAALKVKKRTSRTQMTQKCMDE